MKYVTHKKTATKITTCRELAENTYADGFTDEMGKGLNFCQAWHHLGGRHQTFPIFEGGSDITFWHDEKDKIILQLTFADKEGNSIF